MTTISIIVPVHKVEQYIENCILSIVENSFFDSHCELIVVDDGSPDRSMEIVQRILGITRQNVHLIRQNNQGLGIARNVGESQANGEYLWFVDSDDWLPTGAIEKVISMILTAHPEVINIDYVMSDGIRTTVKNRATPGVIYQGITYLSLSCVQNPVQYYIYQTAFYRSHNLCFEKNIYHEDALFTPKALFLSQRVVRLAEDCYVYNLREGSIMTSGNNLKHTLDMIKILGKLEGFRQSYATDFRQTFILSRYSALAIGGIYYYWRLLDKNDRLIVSAKLDIWLMLKPIFHSFSFKYLLAVANIRYSNTLRLGARNS